MLQVAGCFCEWKGQVLLLLRAPHTSQGSTWCLPGGKVEVGETTLEAAIRETYEEAGVRVDRERAKGVGQIDLPGYTFHMYHTHLAEKPTIRLALEEHTDYTWISPHDAHTLPLIEGGHFVFETVYGQNTPPRKLIS